MLCAIYSKDKVEYINLLVSKSHEETKAVHLSVLSDILSMSAALSPSLLVVTEDMVSCSFSEVRVRVPDEHVFLCRAAAQRRVQRMSFVKVDGKE